MNAAKVTLTATVLAAAFGLALGLAAAPAMADPPGAGGHNHGGGGEDPDPTIELCSVAIFPCIADVGKTRTDTPARQYAGESGYITIGSKDFDKILEMEDSALDLCSAYDVLIFNWNSSTIKKLSWQRLLDYMACGGGVIFESPRNVGLLAAGVGTLEVTVHSQDDFPLTITLDLVPVLTQGPPLNGSTDPFNLPFVNKHIIFDVPSSDDNLMPFLSVENEGVVGLYGDFLDGTGGRIVLTGPDNNFHGDVDPYPGDPQQAEATLNHYNLLFNEINWLLE